METNSIRVVVDTNLWISCMIGKHVEQLRWFFENRHIQNVISQDLLDEIMDVTIRSKFRRYFSMEDVHAMKDWLVKHSIFVELGTIPQRCRDPKDDYLLELAVRAKAIYLVSGDEDLLEIGEIEGCRIMTFAQFVEELSSAEANGMMVTQNQRTHRR